jgi:peroxiredoxin
VMINARRLAEITVLDPEGNTVRLGDLWADRPAVVVWLRHFGCLFCKEQTAEFRSRIPEIARRGAGLVFVGNGNAHYAKGFRDEFCPDCTLLTDPRLASYKAIGARGGLVNTLGPQAWAAGIRAFRRGATQERTQGHPFQQGGVLVIEPGTKVTYSYLSKAAGDHPRVDDVIAAIPVAASATAAR